MLERQFTSNNSGKNGLTSMKGKEGLLLLAKKTDYNGVQNSIPNLRISFLPNEHSHFNSIHPVRKNTSIFHCYSATL